MTRFVAWRRFSPGRRSRVRLASGAVMSSFDWLHSLRRRFAVPTPRPRRVSCSLAAAEAPEQRLAPGELVLGAIGAGFTPDLLDALDGVDAPAGLTAAIDGAPPAGPDGPTGEAAAQEPLFFSTEDADAALVPSAATSPQTSPPVRNEAAEVDSASAACRTA